MFLIGLGIPFLVYAEVESPSLAPLYDGTSYCKPLVASLRDSNGQNSVNICNSPYKIAPDVVDEVAYMTTEDTTLSQPVWDNQESVTQLILDTFPEEPLMVKVAWCESRLDPYANRQNIDVGLFQINQVHTARMSQLGLDRYVPEDNLKYARMLYDESGLGPWYMSRTCWQA